MAILKGDKQKNKAKGHTEINAHIERRQILDEMRPERLGDWALRARWHRWSPITVGSLLQERNLEQSRIYHILHITHEANARI